MTLSSCCASRIKGDVTLASSASRYISVQNPESFCSNRISSSKYTLINFLPKILLEVFSKFANTYFLIVVILQIIPDISVTDGLPTTALPLSAVILVDVITSIIEDIRRHRDDDKTNSTSCLVLSKQNGTCKKVRWDQVHVGDILKIRNRETVPADCIILCASDEPPAAVCYVETKSLDGETNLKLRQGIPRFAEKISAFANKIGGSSLSQSLDATVAKIQGHAESELPNPYIDTYSGTTAFSLADDPEIFSEPLGITNILLRGSVLRSTDFAYGLVINTGHETKIVQSTVSTKGKISELDREINRNIVGFLFLELVLCAILAASNTRWVQQGVRAPKVDDAEFDEQVNPETVAQIFFTFFLLVSNMIPISLYVTMKIARVLQSLFMRVDIETVFVKEDPISGDKERIPLNVKTMDLIDSLGQVSFLFSDKTGTLTNNIMEFRKMSIGTETCGLGNTVIGLAYLERAGKMDEAKAARQLMETIAKSSHPPYVSYLDRPEFPIGAAMGGKLKNSRLVSNQQLELAKEFFFALSVCHSVLVERIRDDNGNDTGSFRYSASSPDDQALVVAAKEFGYSFVGRGEGGKTILIEEGPASTYISDPINYSSSASLSRQEEEQTKKKLPNSYEILEILEFTSLRKRMSIIIRDPKTKKLKLICKGADSELFKRAAKTPTNQAIINRTNEHLIGFANDGLRTLVIGTKEINEEKFNSWFPEYRKAVANITELEKRKNKEDNEIDRLMDEIEEGFMIIGSTAIEDKLQDEVPETIAKLKEAGIKVWVLTGDKQETAINIGFACQLLDQSMKRILINESSADTPQGMRDVLISTALEISGVKNLSRGYKSFLPQSFLSQNASLANKNGNNLNCGLIIDGAALKLALEGECRDLLYDIAKNCKAVVACRVSPKQKAEIVQLIRSKDWSQKTLSIGDGANDVPMIQAAHVGVGISGQEGLQAANASDFSIGQFRFLQRLLFVHGRNNYRRMSKLVVVMFYKNVLLILAQIALSFFNGFSGQKLYLSLAIEFYNVLYTQPLIILLSFYDKDLSDRMLLKFPVLYELGMKKQLFNPVVFWGWILNGIFHAAIAFGVPYFTLSPNEVDIWVWGAVMLTSVIFIANLKIALEIGSWVWFSFPIFVISMLLWPLMALYFQAPANVTITWGWEWLMVYSYSFSPIGVLVTVLTIIMALLRDYTFKAFKREVFPTPAHIIQEVDFLRVRKGGIPDEVVVDGGEILTVVPLLPISSSQDAVIDEVKELDENYDAANKDIIGKETAEVITFKSNIDAIEATDSRGAMTSSIELMSDQLVTEDRDAAGYKGYTYSEDDTTARARRSSLRMSVKSLSSKDIKPET